MTGGRLLPSTPGTPVTHTPRHGRTKSRQYESKHFATLESARKLSRSELLYEAELELVSSRRSRSRSRGLSLADSPGGWESDESELPLPGGWKKTPRKRKRARSHGPSTLSQPRSVGSGDHDNDRIVDKSRSWGVPEWKRLEKTFRAEKDMWLKERDIKPLPGWIGWAKRALGVGQPEAEEWDNNRVVQAFIKAERAQGLGGEWAE